MQAPLDKGKHKVLYIFCGVWYNNFIAGYQRAIVVKETFYDRR